MEYRIYANLTRQIFYLNDENTHKYETTMDVITHREITVNIVI